MHEKIFQRITRITMPTSKHTEPRIGSDEDMIRHGFHRSSPTELEKYGKFVNREGFISTMSGLLRRSLPIGRAIKKPKVVIVAWQIGERISPLDRQSQDQSDTRQNEASSTAVFGEQSGRWQRTQSSQSDPTEL